MALDRHAPLKNAQLPNPPERWGSPIQLPRETMLEFRARFAALEQFASIVTGAEKPCLLDLVAWVFRHHRAKALTDERMRDLIRLYQEADA